jgi:hypothetical protein
VSQDDHLRHASSFGAAAAAYAEMRASHAPPPYHRKAYRPRRTGGEFLT